MWQKLMDKISLINYDVILWYNLVVLFLVFKMTNAEETRGFIIIQA